MRKNKAKSILGARLLRRKATAAENIIWKYLSNRGMCGFKFRRQYPIYGFVIDFFCPEKKLAIEIDGEIHNNQGDRDIARQKIIEYGNISFLRFKNEDVFENIDMVLRTIKRKLTIVRSAEREAFKDIPSPRSGEGCPELVEGRGEDVRSNTGN